MIKFFRSIRKKLIEEDNVRKYLLYAIGEIALVVIGILLALQVNNWNEERKLSLLEISYYENLLEDLQSDSLEYAFKMANARYNTDKILNILDFINHDYDISRTSLRSINWKGEDFTDSLALVMSLSQAGFVQFPQINDNTITDLRTTGNIKLLGNEDLKDDILFYYNRDKVLKQWWETYLPVRTDIDMVVNRILPAHLRVSYLNDEQTHLSPSDFEQIVNQMKQQPKLMELAIGMYHTHWRVIWNGEGRAEETIALITSVRNEIQHLKN